MANHHSILGATGSAARSARRGVSRLAVLFFLCALTAIGVARVHYKRSRPELPTSRGMICNSAQGLVSSGRFSRFIGKGLGEQAADFLFTVYESVMFGERQSWRTEWTYAAGGTIEDVCAGTPERAFLAVQRGDGRSAIWAWDLQPQVGALEVVGLDADGDMRGTLRVIGGGDYICPEARGQPEFRRTELATLESGERVRNIWSDFRGRWLMVLVSTDAERTQLAAKALDLRSGEWTVVATTDSEPALHDAVFLTHFVHEELGSAFLIYPEDMNEEHVILRTPDPGGEWSVSTLGFYDIRDMPGGWESVEQLNPFEGVELAVPDVSGVQCP